jgi:SnoaL-like domain
VGAATASSTREVVERYGRDLYRARNLDLVPELLADPMVRHEAGGETKVLTAAECKTRIGGLFEAYRSLEFDVVQLIVDGEFASWTFNGTLTAHDGTKEVVSGIEVFHVVDGKITEVWNLPTVLRAWG